MTTQQNNLQTNFQIPGDIVAAKVPELRLHLRALVEGGEHGLVLDLSKVGMVDSVGIGLLISVHNTLRKTGRELFLTHVSNDIFELFRTMRMHQHFSISKD